MKFKVKLIKKMEFDLIQIKLGFLLFDFLTLHFNQLQLFSDSNPFHVSFFLNFPFLNLKDFCLPMRLRGTKIILYILLSDYYHDLLCNAVIVIIYFRRQIYVLRNRSPPSLSLILSFAPQVYFHSIVSYPSKNEFGNGETIFCSGFVVMPK